MTNGRRVLIGRLQHGLVLLESVAGDLALASRVRLFHAQAAADWTRHFEAAQTVE